MFFSKNKNHSTLKESFFGPGGGGSRSFANLATTLLRIFSLGKKKKTTRQISSFYPISGKGGVGGTGGGSIKHPLNGGMFGGGGPDLSFNKNEDRNEIRNFNLIQGGDLGGGGTAGGTGHGA